MLLAFGPFAVVVGPGVPPSKAIGMPAPRSTLTALVRPTVAVGRRDRERIV